MFVVILLFLLSLVVEIIFLTFIDPDQGDIILSQIVSVLFALNSGLLVGSLFCLILLFFYFKIQAVTDLQSKSFIRRGVLLGAITTVLLLFRIYKLDDLYIIILTVLTFIALEVVLSIREEN